MVLDNYWLWRSFTDGHAAQVASPNNTYLGIKNLVGADIPICTQANYGNETVSNMVRINYSLATGLTARIGISDAEPQHDEYCLVEDVTAHFNDYNVTFNYSHSDGVYKITCSITGISSTNNRTWVIREVGIVKSVAFNNNSAMIEDNTMLIRQVLENPIAVPPHQGVSITLEWIMTGSNYLNNYMVWREWTDSTPYWLPGDRYYPTDCILVNLEGVTDCAWVGWKGAPYGTCMTYSIRNGLSTRVGSGTRRVSYDDYCLESDVTSKFTSYTTSFNWTTVETGYHMIATITGRNISSETVKVSEVGLVTLVYWYQDAATSKSNSIMMIRTLLDNPIYVSPGRSINLTLEWEIH